MTHPTLTLLLLSSVSPGALECGLVERAVCLGTKSTQPKRNTALSLLARVQLWISLIFRGLSVKTQAEKVTQTWCLNRHNARRSKHKIPLACSTYALGHILLRRYGVKRFVQWLYNFTLISRIERCFRLRRNLWTQRKAVASCKDAAQMLAVCNAMLRPD